MKKTNRILQVVIVTMCIGMCFFNCGMLDVYAKGIGYGKQRVNLKEWSNVSTGTLNCKCAENTLELKEKVIVEFNVTDETGILYATTSVNIRELPDASTKKVGLLSYAQEIEKTGICDNGWTRVKYNGEDAYINSKYLSAIKPEPVVVESYSGFIQNIGGVDVNLVNKFNSYYMMIPENVRNHFQNNGWSIYATTESIGQKYYGQEMSILALTVVNEKAIYIDDREKAVKAVIHEMGHYINYSYGFVSSSAEFTEIFNAEKETFCSIHSTHSNNTSTSVEYFAEFYMVAITNPNAVKDSCPRTYEFVTRYANGL